MEDSLIHMRDIGKIYGGAEVETLALTGVDLRIGKGEFVSLVGPSGCGKSTLLSLVGLLDQFTTGHYRFNGLDTAVLDRDARARIRNHQIGFIFQSFNLVRDMTVAENVALPLRWRGDLNRGQMEERATDALTRVGLQHRRDYFPGQLSGGQQQRVAVARTVAGRPLVVLADEPTGNLDTQNAEKVLSLLEVLHADGVTICLATHDTNLAARAQRSVELLDGRVVSDQDRR